MKKNTKRYYAASSKHPFRSDPNLTGFQPSVIAALKACVKEEDAHRDDIKVYEINVKPIKVFHYQFRLKERP